MKTINKNKILPDISLSRRNVEHGIQVRGFSGVHSTGDVRVFYDIAQENKSLSAVNGKKHR